jgi:hypothetical protein
MLLLVEDRTLDVVVALLKEETSIVCPLFISDEHLKILQEPVD